MSASHRPSPTHGSCACHSHSLSPSPTSIHTHTHTHTYIHDPQQQREWQLNQFMDSAFPSGGFNHSSGLEAFYHLHVNQDPDPHKDTAYTRLVEYILLSLYNSVYASCDVVVDTYAMCCRMVSGCECGCASGYDGDRRDGEEGKHAPNEFTPTPKQSRSQALMQYILMQDTEMDMRTSTQDTYNEASKLQGTSLLNTSIQVFFPAPSDDPAPDPALDPSKEDEDGVLPNQVLREWKEFIRNKQGYGHFNVVFGVVLALMPWSGAHMGINTGTGGRETLEAAKLIQMYMFWQTRALVSAGVRLGMVGAIQGQALMAELYAAIPLLIAVFMDKERCATTTSTCPVLDLCSCLHKTLYSRLFSS